MCGRAGEAGIPREIVECRSLRASGRDEAEQMRCARDRLRTGDACRNGFHIVDGTARSAHIARTGFRCGPVRVRLDAGRVSKECT
ncbi:hypothetical protein GCM10010489_19720 [Microbacterium saperdae]|nr:hypothetical protein GCM10010489_19720 [Microbacterium saperdae]